MKTLLTLTFLLTASISYGQLSLNSSVGYGAKVNSKKDVTLFQSSITFQPKYEIDKFSLSGVVMAVNSDSLSEMFSGVKVGYEVWKQKSKSLTISAQGLLGFEGKKLLGGGIAYGVDNVFLSVDASQENKNKEFWFNLSLGYLLLQ